MTGAEALLFWVLAPATVLGALGLLFARKAVHAAMSMALVMVSMGIFYIAQHAEFVGIIQIFVYSGAVMMLFLFVVMTIGVDTSDSMIEPLAGQRVWSWILGILFLALGVTIVGRVSFPDTVEALAAAQAEGSITALAREIFSVQVFGFEILGTLLVIAVMGAMVLAHRERLLPRRDQRASAARRVRSGQWLAGKPNPGIYARHNASDTPALLPDGTPTEISVPRVLVARDQLVDPEIFAEATETAYESIGTGFPHPDTPVPDDADDQATRDSAGTQSTEEAQR